MISRRSALGVLVCGAVATGARAEGDRAVLRGTVTYRERMALPPGAVLVVRVDDVSLMDAPSVTLAESRQEIVGSAPIHYVVSYPKARPGQRLAVSADILDGDNRMFMTQDFHSPDEPDIVVKHVSAAPVVSNADAPYGAWDVTMLAGGGVVEGASLVLEKDGSVHGSAGCNRLMGHVTVKGETVRFGRMATTMMMCQPPQMTQEKRVLDVLKRVSRWAYSPEEGLHFKDSSGKDLMVLFPQQGQNRK